MKLLKQISLLLVLAFSINGYSQEKLAILPFTFTDNGHLSEQEGKNAQKYLIEYINKKQKHFKVKAMNARNINVALHKAGITIESLDDYTTKEIADAVGADYILLGSIDKTLQGSNNVNVTTESKNSKGWNKNSKNTFGSSSSNNTYEATVYISIFDKNNNSIYDKSKGNVFIDFTSDSWKNSIVWHVRHFPLYH